MIGSPRPDDGDSAGRRCGEPAVTGIACLGDHRDHEVAAESHAQLASSLAPDALRQSRAPLPRLLQIFRLRIPAIFIGRILALVICAPIVVIAVKTVVVEFFIAQELEEGDNVGHNRYLVEASDFLPRYHRRSLLKRLQCRMEAPRREPPRSPVACDIRFRVEFGRPSASVLWPPSSFALAGAGPGGLRPYRPRARFLSFRSCSTCPSIVLRGGRWGCSGGHARVTANDPVAD